MGVYQSKQFVGYQVCPECGFESAELKGDKNGDLYRWCPEESCALQTFTRGRPARVKRMLDKMRPAVAPAVEAGAVKKKAPAPAPEATPAPAKKKGSAFFATLMDDAS